MKNKFWYLYYLFMILVLALSVKMDISSNIIRIVYLAALVVPLLNNTVYYPAIIIYALCIVKNTFALVLVPTNLVFYTLISFVFAVISFTNRSTFTRIRLSFLLPILYVCINDFLFQGSLTIMSSGLVLMALIYISAINDLDTSTTTIALSFIFLSLTISFWMLFIPEARMTIYNTLGDMAQESFADPNYLGCTLGLGLVLSVKELLSIKKNRIYLSLLILTIVLSAITLVTLATRGITLSVGGSIIVLLFFSKVKKSTKFITIVGLVLLLVFLYNNNYTDFLLSRFETANETGGNRLPIWGRKISSFFEQGNLLNYLFGFGQEGGFRLGFSVSGGYSTHNDFVSMLVYYGFVGLALFVSSLLYPIVISSPQKRPQVVALVVYLALCSMSIEPFARGKIASLAFLFYIIILARQSKKGTMSNCGINQ